MNVNYGYCKIIFLISTICPCGLIICTKYIPVPPQVAKLRVVLVPDAVIGVVATDCPKALIMLMEPPAKLVMLLKLMLTSVLAGLGAMVMLLAQVTGLVNDSCPTLIIKVSVTVMFVIHWLALYKLVISCGVSARFQMPMSSIEPLKNLCVGELGDLPIVKLVKLRVLIIVDAL